MEDNKYRKNPLSSRELAELMNPDDSDNEEAGENPNTGDDFTAALPQEE